MSSVSLGPAQIIEGSLWGAWFGYQGYQLHNAVHEKTTIEDLPDSASGKAVQIWNARKKVFLSSAMTTSAGAFVASWAREVGLINFGPLNSLVTSLGFIGTVVTSPFYLWEGIKELKKTFSEYSNVSCFTKKKDIILKGCDQMANIAMLVCFIGWGILGIAYTFFGGLELFLISDNCFLYGAIFFLMRLGYALFLDPSKQKEKTPPSPA